MGKAAFFIPGLGQIMWWFDNFGWFILNLLNAKIGFAQKLAVLVICFVSAAMFLGVIPFIPIGFIDPLPIEEIAEGGIMITSFTVWTLTMLFFNVAAHHVKQHPNGWGKEPQFPTASNRAIEATNVESRKGGRGTR